MIFSVRITCAHQQGKKEPLQEFVAASVSIGVHPFKNLPRGQEGSPRIVAES